MSATATASRGRRIARPVRLVVVGMVVLVLLAAAFVAGRLFPADQGPSAAAVAAPIDVWASVERRALDASATFAGTAEEGEQQTVAVVSEGPAVVLRTTVGPGDRVSPGGLAGEVSGVAHVFLAGPLALYRDLTEGDRGEDVASLQRSLKAAGHWTATDGVLDARTARALRELFRAADAPLPADAPVTVSPGQFVAIPAEGAVVASVAEYGTTLSEEMPLMTLTVSDPSVRFTADVVQAASLSEGQQVRITSSAGTTTGRIREVGEFQTGSEGAASGHPVTVAFDAADASAPPVGQSVTVSTTAEGPAEESLTVPQTALHADGSGQFVLVQDAADSIDSSAAPAEHRVPVQVTDTGGGYAAVTGELSPGDRVKVS